jgi:hypothetical protein
MLDSDQYEIRRKSPVKARAMIESGEVVDQASRPRLIVSSAIV